MLKNDLDAGAVLHGGADDQMMMPMDVSAGGLHWGADGLVIDNCSTFTPSFAHHCANNVQVGQAASVHGGARILVKMGKCCALNEVADIVLHDAHLSVDAQNEIMLENMEGYQLGSFSFCVP